MKNETKELVKSILELAWEILKLAGKIAFIVLAVYGLIDYMKS